MTKNQEDTMFQTMGSSILGLLISGKFLCLQCISIEEITDLTFSQIVTAKDTHLVRPKTHQYCERMGSKFCMGFLW